VCLDVYQEKKPYIDKAAELKVSADNGEATAVSPYSNILLQFCPAACSPPIGITNPRVFWDFCLILCQPVMQEDNGAVEKGEVADDEEEQVDQPPNHDDGEQEDEEKNELDDDI
jgi:hypothetical protein